MFTGLVQAIGTLERTAGGLRVHWDRLGFAQGQLALGDSVAVDGVCLTVAHLLPHGFLADVSGETLERSTLGAKAERGAKVNLEPALRLADRLGGHLVSGHVDGLGTVKAIESQGSAWRLEVDWIDSRYGRYICEKASVAIDGISLTVAGCSPRGDRFWMAVIPHTWTSPTLQHLRSGDAVNLEADLLAKYTERLLQERTPGQPSELNHQWLNEHGWG